MARGRLDLPNLDDRTWQVLVDQAKALVSQYAPEWTDLGLSDPGITLIEMFAWLVEGMIYRLNRVPDKNYIAFLNLLGITRSPATPATTWLTYTSSQTTPVTLDATTQAATQQTETQPAIVFETDKTLIVFPGRLTRLYLEDQQGNKIDLTPVLVGSSDSAPRQGISGWAWKDSDGQNVIFWLGFEDLKPESLGDQPYELHVEVGEPPSTWDGQASLTEDYLTGAVPVKIPWPGLRTGGTIALTPAKNWAPTAIKDGPATDPDATKPRYWLKLTISLDQAIPKGARFDFRHILFNGVSATAVQSVKDELLGLGTGKPFQSFDLANRPVYRDVQATGDPYAHVQVRVAGTLWNRVDVFDPSPDQDQQVFRLDPVAGTIDFGDGSGSLSTSQAGTTDASYQPSGGEPPPAGTRIIASYRWVPDGAAGNVPAGAVNTQRPAVPGIADVRNPFPASGGVDEQDIEETKRLAPQALQSFGRAVTAADYEELARQGSMRVKTVRCLGPKGGQVNPLTTGRLLRGDGCVSVIIIPELTVGTDPSQVPGPKFLDPEPRPSLELVHEVQRYLDDRRPLTARLTVTGPRYVALTITVNVHLWPGALSGAAGSQDSGSIASLTQTIDNAIVGYLHPIEGKSDGKGWKIGEWFFMSGLFSILQQIIGDLGYIESLKANAQAEYAPPDRPSDLPKLDPSNCVPIADYEILCSVSKPDPQAVWHTIKISSQARSPGR